MSLTLNPFAFMVDGITYTTPHLWVRKMFELVNDHRVPEVYCWVCTNYPGATKEQMRWTPGDPVVRFTSEGLKTA